MKISVLMLCVFLSALSMKAFAADDDGVDLATCQNAMASLNSVTDTDLLNACADFFFDNGGDENPPGSFNNTIALLERSIDVNPYQAEDYTNAAWLLWSKWDTWHLNPSLMPDGATKAQEAVDICERGEIYFSQNSAYYLDVQNTLEPLAKQYLPQYWPVVMNADLLAEQYAPDTATHVRARLNLGHAYRYQNLNNQAIAWYRSVLELDATNKVALTYLKQLCGTAAECSQPGPLPSN